MSIAWGEDRVEDKSVDRKEYFTTIRDKSRRNSVSLRAASANRSSLIWRGYRILHSRSEEMITSSNFKTGFQVNVDSIKNGEDSASWDAASYDRIET